MARGGADPAFIVAGKPRRADDMDDARLRGQSRQFDGKPRPGEID